MRAIDAFNRRRYLPGARRAVKAAQVRLDVVAHGRDPGLRQWLPVLADARSGHIVVPTRALATSRGQAMDWVRHGLVHQGDRVLDVGAGNGRSAVGLLEIGVSSYVGLEVERGSVEHANTAFAGLGPVHFDLLDVANPMYNPGGSMAPAEVTLPYPDASFDFVVASSLYTHLERPEVAARYLAETARVLVDGGGAFASFFRSPPNAVSTSAVRTVYAEGDVTAAAGAHFDVLDSIGGTTGGFHDQWMLYLRKHPAA